MNLAEYRIHYTKGELDAPLPDDPIDLFRLWVEEAIADESVHEPNAMALATIDRANDPQVRMVLFKEVRQDGLVFYTNYQSAKGKELKANPKAAATVWWPEREQQIRFMGEVHKISAAESDAYFVSRPRGSQLGAIVSPQSQIIPDKEYLIRRLSEKRSAFAQQSEIPRPANWGGFYLRPYAVEFWQGRPNRLHDRFRYRKDADGQWFYQRLAP